MRRTVAPDFLESWLHVYLDEHGRVQFENRAMRRREPAADNTVNEESVQPRFLSACGRYLSHYEKANLVSCLCCRRGRRASWFYPEEPATLGICLEETAVRCQEPGCGAWCCPRHAHGSSNTGWRCRDCAESLPLLEALLSVFFKR